MNGWTIITFAIPCSFACLFGLGMIVIPERTKGTYFAIEKLLSRDQNAIPTNQENASIRLGGLRIVAGVTLYTLLHDFML